MSIARGFPCIPFIWGEGAYSRGVWLLNMLAQAKGTYPGEGAYQSEEGYSKKYGTCRSEPSYFSDYLR